MLEMRTMVWKMRKWVGNEMVCKMKEGVGNEEDGWKKRRMVCEMRRTVWGVRKMARETRRMVWEMKNCVGNAKEDMGNADVVKNEDGVENERLCGK